MKRRLFKQYVFYFIVGVSKYEIKFFFLINKENQNFYNKKNFFNIYLYEHKYYNYDESNEKIKSSVSII